MRPIRRRRAGVALCAAAALLAAAAPASAKPRAVPDLAWEACEEAPGWECATALVPRSYGRSNGKLRLAVTRLPAADPDERIGTLFVNYGGPGAGAVGPSHAFGEFLFAPLLDRFDLVAFDPRGTDGSDGAIDCGANQETEGPYSNPYFEPGDDLGAYLDRVERYWDKCRASGLKHLQYASTANYARDMDLLRRALGDRKLNYFGFSYGTFIGATYAALFPQHHRAMVLDGPVDPDQYINRPLSALAAQTAGLRARRSAASSRPARWPGTSAPSAGTTRGWPTTCWWSAPTRRPSRPVAPIRRPVTGDEILNATVVALYTRYWWTDLAVALEEAAAGDATLLRQMSDDAYGREDDGTYGPGTDRYIGLSAEQRYPGSILPYLEQGEQSWTSFDHFWFNSGYVELYWRAIPVSVKDAYYGPWDVPRSASTPLVIGTRYDPATPYRSAKRLVQRMGNARLLTLNGDGHTGFFHGSDCIDARVIDYIITLELPEPRTQCAQDIPFPLPSGDAAGQGVAASGAARGARLRRARPGAPARGALTRGHAAAAGATPAAAAARCRCAGRP